MNLSAENERRNHIAYIIEAALEYFISILITDAFIATLLTQNGFSDTATGIVTQLASLAFIAQLFSVFYRKKTGMKRFVTIMHLVNQLMYVTLYMIPGISLPSTVKGALIVVMFLGGHIVANIVSPYKLSWLMSFVPDSTRGRFTANKEIVSLIGGMIFSYVMGSLSDHYNEIGEESTGMLICGVTIFVLSALHLISLLCIKERPAEENEPVPEKVDMWKAVRGTFTNKTLMKVLLVDIIWHFATGISTSFYGVYKINQLGFSLRYVSILSIMYSLSRVLFSRFFGKLADKTSWSRMLTICFTVAAAAFFLNIFTVPSNGKVMFAVYYCTYAVAMAGINSGLMNIIFDYVPSHDKGNGERAAALGIKYAAGGLSAFFAALVGGVILSSIQGAGDMLGSLHVYAQQVLSAIAFVCCAGLVVYMKTVVTKLKK